MLMQRPTWPRHASILRAHHRCSQNVVTAVHLAPSLDRPLDLPFLPDVERPFKFQIVMAVVILEL